MGRSILATLVGAIIFFGFQALSWMALPIHDHTVKYSPAQDSILHLLQSELQEEGVYAFPHHPPGTSQAEQQELGKAMEGKPWAIVFYHPVMETNMGKSMGIGFLVVFVSVAIAVWLTGKIRTQSFFSRFAVSFCLGIFLVLQGSLTNWNWMSFPMHYVCGEIMDIMIGWTLVGIWLGAFLKPRRA